VVASRNIGITNGNIKRKEIVMKDKSIEDQEEQLKLEEI